MNDLSVARPIKVWVLIKRFLFPGWLISLIYYFKFKAKISPKSEVELSHNIKMGYGCVISSFTKLKASEGTLHFGNRCGIASGSFISSGEKGIFIGDNFVCGPNVIITASNYNYEKIDVHIEDQGHTSKGIRIGNNVWVGGGSVILDGSYLGNNTIVVANSLVNRRFPDNVILQGNPAKIIFRRK